MKTDANLIAGATKYAEADDQSLAIIGTLHGFDLAKFDSFLITIADTPHGSELMEWREYAVRSAKEGNGLALRGWLNALLVAWKWSRREDFILPLARSGDAHKKQQSERASKGRKLTDEQKASIVKEYSYRIENGEKYGLTKDLARRYDVSTTTVKNVVRKTPKNAISK